MTKRKAPCPRDGINKPSVSSLDAAFDLLANETFSKIDHLVKKFEAATCILLNDGVAKARWEEACKRYWVTKAMEELCCGSRPAQDEADSSGNIDMKADVPEEEGRPLPHIIYPGAAVRHRMSIGEEQEWKKWIPRVGDMVLVDLRNDQLWPGKIIDRRVFYQGRVIPRGNHFFPVRIYSEGMEPVVTVKSRMIPLELRPEPPLLASTLVLTAFNHARHPSGFDKSAEEREKKAARERSHSGVHRPEEQDRIKARKDEWNDQVNWVMSERRVEKMRNINEEREKRLQSVAKDPEPQEKVVFEEEWGPSSSKRNCIDVSHHGKDGGIFAVPPNGTPPRSHTASPLFRPAIGSPQRAGSPRRLDKRRNGIYAGMGEYSPRGRRTYTPPRILPSGDETAPTMQTSPSPLPSSLRQSTFDFISPLGPVHGGALTDGPRRSGSMSRLSLEAVKEEPLEDEGEGEWTVVQKRGQRSGSAPCRDRDQKVQQGTRSTTLGMEVEAA